MNWLEEFPHIAHRGLHGGGVIENSEKSFQQAIALNYAIELDIQFLLNGDAIVFHDSDLSRLFSNPIKIQDINPNLLHLLKYPDKTKILYLSDVLEIVDSNVPILIEIKRDTYSATGLRRLLRELSNYKGRFSIQSFDPQIIAEVKKLYPHFSVGQLITNWFSTDIDWWKKIAMNVLPFIREVNFFSINHMQMDQWQRFMAFKRNIPIIAWTIEDKVQQEKAMDWADAIIFEKFKP